MQTHALPLGYGAIMYIISFPMKMSIKIIGKAIFIIYIKSQFIQELDSYIIEPSKLHTSTLKNHSLNRALTSSDVQGQVFDRLVTVRSMHHCTSTPALSTSSSSRGLIIKWGYLILEGASRLDAFSVYPFRAWLLCHEPGGPTDTPAARPPRSSRTKGSSPQISYAHAG